MFTRAEPAVCLGLGSHFHFEPQLPLAKRVGGVGCNTWLGRFPVFREALSPGLSLGRLQFLGSWPFPMRVTPQPVTVRLTRSRLPNTSPFAQRVPARPARSRSPSTFPFAQHVAVPNLSGSKSRAYCMAHAEVVIRIRKTCVQQYSFQLALRNLLPDLFPV